MEGSQSVSISPSFNSYYSSSLADIAARVVQECRHQSFSDFDYLQDDFPLLHTPPENLPLPEEEPAAGDGSGDDDDDDSEFSFACRDAESSPISADEIFSNGQIRPSFPLFNTDLLFAADDSKILKDSKDSKPPPPPPPPPPPAVRLPLGRLLMEDRETWSCSSSEADELEGVPEESYCVWTPSAATASRRSCKKSHSTGTTTSSKRWKIRDLLFRSSSDGKDAFLFLAPSFGGSSRKKDHKIEKPSSYSADQNVTFADLIAAGKTKPKAAAVAEGGEIPANGEESKGEAERRRLLVPHKQELVGLFSNVSGLSRNVHPF